MLVRAWRRSRRSASGAFWRFADARRPPPVVQPVAPDPATLPARDDHAAAVGSPSARVCCRARSTSAALQAALQPLLGIGRRQPLLRVGHRRATGRREERDASAVAGQQPEDPHRRGRARRARPGLHLLDQGGRARSAPTVWSQGDLYLVGGGDPVLASEWWNGNNPKWPPFNETSFESLADAIQQHGVTKITGGVIGDGSRYDDEFFAPTWAAADHVTQAGPDRRSAGQRLVADAAGRGEGSGARRGDGVARPVEGPRHRGWRRVDRPVAAGAATIAEVQSQPLAGDPRRDADDERQQHRRDDAERDRLPEQGSRHADRRTCRS